MSVMEQIRAKAKAANRHIVLPEGTEDRTIKAAAQIVSQGNARVTLVGSAAEISEKAAQYGVDLAASPLRTRHGRAHATVRPGAL